MRDLILQLSKSSIYSTKPRGSAKLFNLKRKPWIIPDEVDVETVVRVIDTCPSGALQYRQK
ncbi:(4Fe-4S)-binding protein [Enterobacter cloacae]|uniref:(4Fe-4S)-binding protein n=1 Tax=Enterobacter cloacae TaxID=550 RepID=UPI0021BEE3D9|nr:(4Fe-4S)-binding protein [Enterobacter cloacae]MCT9038634.1 (4Fe-4S)-binding protein [Enterobacter cloacae]